MHKNFTVINKGTVAMKDITIAIIGLGYVGLPLAIEFSRVFDVIGLDTNQARVDELVKGNDSTLEVSAETLVKNKNLRITANCIDL